MSDDFSNIVDEAVDAAVARSRVRLLSRMTPATEAENERLARERENRKIRDDVASAIGSTGIPQVGLAEYIYPDESRIATPPALAAIRTACNWWRRRRNPMVLVVSGPPGTAKTTSMCRLLVRQQAINHVQALYVDSRLLVATPAEGKTTRNGEWIDHREQWEKWERCGLLGIDDLGVERAVDWFEPLIEQRYNEGSATIVTTNLDAAQFVARYQIGARLLDRLVNGQGHAGEPTGQPWWVRVDGPSLRNPKARAEFIASQGRAA